MNSFGDKVMLIPGIPHGDLERIHFNNGHGKSSLAYKHVPSGIMVSCKCSPGIPVIHICRTLLSELEEQLKLARIVSCGDADSD